MKSRIATKITALAIVLVLITAGVIGIIAFTGYDAVLVNRELESLGEELPLQGTRLVSGIKALRQDVLLLSATPPIQGLIRAQAAGGVDPLDGSTEAEWRQRLTAIFTEFLRAKPTYLNVSYIGMAEEGSEIVRIDRLGDTIVAVTGEHLQSRGDTAYFQEAIRLGAGQVYLSNITLKREYGQVVEPHIPVLRAAVPVYTPQGEVFGIVVINMDFRPALEGTPHERHTMFVTNDAGDLLEHPDPAMTFGFDMGERHRIQEIYPELAPLFEPGNDREETSFRSEASGVDQAVHFLKVAFDPQRPDRFLGLAQSVPYEDVVAGSTTLLHRSILLTMLLIVAAAVLTFFFSRLLTRPLNQITQAARGFTEGVLDAPLPVEATDEIGVLARAFRTMIQRAGERSKALRESQDRYRTLFKLAGDAILMVLPPEGEGDILDANQAAVQLLGYSKEELRKLNGRQIIAPEAVEETNRERSAQVKDKGYFLLETIWVRKDGSRVPVSVSGKPLEIRGEVQFQLIGRDISEWVQAEAERRKLSRAVEQTADGVLITDASGVIQYVNPAFVRMTGYTKEELLGNTPRVLKSGTHNQEVYEELWTTILAGKTFRGTLINRKKDGELFHVDQNITPLKDAQGEITHFVATSKDISERVQAEEERRQVQERIQRQHETLIRLSTHPAVAAGRLEEALSAITRAVAEILNVERVNVWQLSPDGHELRCLEAFERSQGRHSAGYILQAEEYPRYFAALDTGRTARVTHTKTDPRTVELAAEYWEPLGINSAIEAPVRLHGQLVGVVCHEHVGPPRAWTSDEVAFASKVADLVTQTFLNADIRRRDAQQQALNAIIVAAASTSDLSKLLETALEHILQALGLQVGAIWVADQRAARGIAPEQIWNLVRTAQEERLDLSGPAVVADWSIEGVQLSSAMAGALDQSGIRASITVPLRAEQQITGGLSVAAPEPRSWLSEEIALVEAAGAQLGAAAERLRLFQETNIHDQMMVRLAAISESLNRPFTVAEVVAAIGQGVLALLQADRAAVTLRQPDDSITISWAQGLSSAYLAQIPVQLQDLWSQMIEQADPTLISDVARLPEGAALRDVAQMEGYRAVCLWPLVYEERLVALTSCYYDEPHTWLPREQEVLEAFARQASMALENARLFENAQRRLEHVQALREIDLAITASLDLRVTLNVFLDQVLSQLDVDAAAVLLFNPHTQILEHAAKRGFRTNALQHTHLRLGEGYAGRAALEQRVIYIPNLREVDKPFVRASLIATEDFITYYALPLIAKGQVVGVLETFHRVPLKMNPEQLEFMDVLATQAAIAVDNASLFNDLQRSNVDLRLAYDATLEGWSRAMDLRDEETEGHTQRVTKMTLRLARAIGMSEEELVHVRRGALLHDMGKMGVPDSVLLKPGPLTDEEWEVMRQHPVFAYEMLAPIPYLRPALDIPYCHHEKWDGTGYPRGLKGEAIPLAARVFAVADVWDALRNDRPYRKAWTEKKVRKHIQAGSGTHFDPQVVKAFLTLVV